MIHELKTWPVFYQAIVSGAKQFEFRKEDDRQFAVGDTLRLREWCPSTGDYTTRHCSVRVSYVLRGFPLPREFCCMSITDLDD